MKKRILPQVLILALLAIPSAPADDQTPSPTPSPTATPIIMGGCNHSSWNPELYTYFGASSTIIPKLGKFPADLSDRRVFFQVTQGDGKAEIKYFERLKEGKIRVLQWKQKHTPGLLGDIERAIIANQGIECIGEKIKALVVKELGKADTTETIENFSTPLDFFSDSVTKASGKFIQTTIILLC